MTARSEMCVEIRHGTGAYDEAVALRDEVLRKPLGLRFFREELAGESDSFHLAYRKDGKIVGCLVLRPLDERRVRMRQFAVAAEFQGKGVGRALVDFSEAFARDRGFVEVVLHAREAAVGFYGKMGYEVVGERFTEVTLPHFPMRKILTAGFELEKD